LPPLGLLNILLGVVCVVRNRPPNRFTEERFPTHESSQYEVLPGVEEQLCLGASLATSIAMRGTRFIVDDGLPSTPLS
jgi:hypothetical protein